MPKKPPTAEEMTEAKQIAELLSNRKWRLFSGKLYHIKDKNGKKVPFIPNKAQTRLYERISKKNIILKARQLGFSTFIDIMELDNALFSSYSNFGIIAQDVDSSKLIFRDKVKFAFDNLPPWLKALFKVKTDRAGELMFESNQCVISVDTSFRGGTLQSLHISEFGKICSKTPDKAREIVTGALNTVSPDSEVFIESTAEGNSGTFYDMCQKAISLQEMGREITDMDYKFHFFTWFEEDAYELISDDIITQETEEYFQKLEAEPYILSNYPLIKFSDAKKRWYQKKKEEQQDDMQREYPSFPQEAFNMAIAGSYYEKEMGLIRVQNRICRMPYDPRLETYTCWDIGGAGGGDECAVWWFQIHGQEVRWIDYWEGSGYSIIDVANTVIKVKPYKYTYHIFPHDAEVHEQTSGITRLEVARQHLGRCYSVKRMGISDGINNVRNILAVSWFDEEKCSKGISNLSSYRREFDDKNGVFRDKPKHGPESHGADSIRYGATELMLRGFKPKVESSLYMRDDGLEGLMNSNTAVSTNYDFFD